MEATWENRSHDNRDGRGWKSMGKKEAEAQMKCKDDKNENHYGDER